MVTRNPLLALALAAVLVTAGCSTGGTPTPTADGGQTNATVSLVNTGDRPYTAEVSLVPGRLDQVNVEYANGVSRPVANLSSVPGVYAFARQNVTDVRLPPGAEARSSSRFELLPGDQSETRLSTPDSETTLLVVIRQNDRVAAWATVYCGRNATLDRVDMRASGGDPGRIAGVDVSCARR